MIILPPAGVVFHGAPAGFGIDGSMLRIESGR